MSNTKEKKGFFARASRFFRDMFGEMKKVVWPSKKQTINNTVIVLSFVALVALIIAGFDTGLEFLLKVLFGTL